MADDDCQDEPINLNKDNTQESNGSVRTVNLPAKSSDQKLDKSKENQGVTVRVSPDHSNTEDTVAAASCSTSTLDLPVSSTEHHEDSKSKSSSISSSDSESKESKESDSSYQCHSLFAKDAKEEEEEGPSVQLSPESMPLCARRCLWKVDRSEVDENLKDDLSLIYREENISKSVKWNYDFEHDVPLGGSWHWEKTSEPPSFYQTKNYPVKKKINRHRFSPYDRTAPTSSDSESVPCSSSSLPSLVTPVTVSTAPQPDSSTQESLAKDRLGSKVTPGLSSSNELSIYSEILCTRGSEVSSSSVGDSTSDPRIANVTCSVSNTSSRSPAATTTSMISKNISQSIESQNVQNPENVLPSTSTIATTCSISTTVSPEPSVSRSDCSIPSSSFYSSASSQQQPESNERVSSPPRKKKRCDKGTSSKPSSSSAGSSSSSISPLLKYYR